MRFDSKKISSDTISTLLLLFFIGWLYLRYNFTGDYETDIADFDYRRIAIIEALLLLSYPIFLTLKDGYKAFMRADVLVATSMIYWALLDVIQDRYSLNSVSAESIRYTFVLIAVFAIAVQVSSNFSFSLPSTFKKISTFEIKGTTLFAALLFCISISIFQYWRASYYDFSYMLESLTRSRFNAPWARAESGGINAFYEHLKYFGYITPALSVLIYIKDEKITTRVVISFLLTLFFSAFEFQGGGRRITGFLAGSGMVTWMVANKNRLKIRHFLIIGVLFVGLIILLDMQLKYRNVGYENMFESYQVEEFEQVRVDDNFLRIAQITEFVPVIHPYSGIQYLVWAFARPVPRFFWPGKPTGPGFSMADLANERGVSLSMTVVGESYASFGMIMVILIGCFFGMLAGTLNNILYSDLSTLGYAVYSLGLMALVAGVRSLADLIIFSYALLGLVVIYKTYLQKKAKPVATS